MLLANCEGLKFEAELASKGNVNRQRDADSAGKY